MGVKEIDLGLSGYDALFSSQEEREENRLPKIHEIPLSEIDDFPDHPFKVKLDEDMDQLVQSVKERGITLLPTLVITANYSTSGLVIRWAARLYKKFP